MKDKILKMILNFFRKMLSDSSEVSVKRVIALIMAGLVIEIVNAYLWFGRSVPEFVFFGVIGLIPTVLGISAAVQMNANKYVKPIETNTDVDTVVEKVEEIAKKL